MSLLTIIILAFSMSADAFGAAVARGACERPNFPNSVKAGALFGIIEATNIALGWFLGLAASSFVTAIDHWIAFILLSAVGGKMVYEGLWGRAGNDVVLPEPQSAMTRNLSFGLVATAFGTSIDSAAVGITLAFLDTNIAAVVLAVGLATFTMATTGMMVGRIAGNRLGSVVETIAGVVLIGLGTKILLEHTGYLG